MHQRFLLQPRGSVSHSKNVFCCYIRTKLLSLHRVCFCSPSREGLSKLCIGDKIYLETAYIFATRHRRSFICRLSRLGSLAIGKYRKVNVTTKHADLKTLLTNDRTVNEVSDVTFSSFPALLHAFSCVVFSESASCIWPFETLRNWPAWQASKGREGREKKRRFGRKKGKVPPTFSLSLFSPYPFPFLRQAACCAFHFAFPFYMVYTRNKNKRSRRNMQEQSRLECPLFHKIIHGKLILEDNCSQLLRQLFWWGRKKNEKKKTPPLLIRWSNLSTPVVTFLPTLFPSSPIHFQPSRGRLWLMLSGYGCACLIGSLQLNCFNTPLELSMQNN